MLLLGLIWAGTLCNGMMIPFMGFYIIEGLGQAPWIFSLYSGLVMSLSLIVNRVFAGALDRGAAFAPFILISALGFVVAAMAVLVAPSIGVVMTLTAFGFGLATGFMATAFTMARKLAEAESLNTDRYNAVVRAVNSAAWMLGPALSFGLTDAFGLSASFIAAIICGVAWICLLPVSIPKGFSVGAIAHSTADGAARKYDPALWMVLGGCFCLALAHALTTSALPLFYTQEAGLPTFAPGLSFTVKTFIEVFAILAAPMLVAKAGAQQVLAVTSLIACAALFVLSGVTSFPQLIMGAALEGLYYGLFAGTAISLVQSFANGRMAGVTALYVNILSASFLIAGPAAGLIGQFWLFQNAIQISIGFAVASFAIFFVLSRKIAGAAP